MNTQNLIRNDGFKIKANWNVQSQQLKSIYSQLSVSDLRFENGKGNELLSRVEHRLNEDRNSVMGIINRNQSFKQNLSKNPDQPGKTNQPRQ